LVFRIQYEVPKNLSAFRFPETISNTHKATRVRSHEHSAISFQPFAFHWSLGFGHSFGRSILLPIA
jgi:hypothetical protein